MVDFVRQCEYCRFYSGGQKCTAFPAGIDTAVFAGVISHLVPLPGDGGVQFLPVQSSAFGFAAALKAEQARVPAGGPHGGEFASNKGGTASEIFARGDLPSAPGTAPIKPGYVRLYHQTPEENVGSIMKEGLTMARAKGVEGPRAIYASEKGFYGTPGERPTIEFQVPRDQWDDPFVLREVTPADMIAAHLPWHGNARYLSEDDPQALANTLAGQNDDLGGDYAPAVAYIKRKFGKI